MVQAKYNSSVNAVPLIARFSGIVLITAGLISMLGARVAIWLTRGKFMEVGPLVFKAMGHNSGGLVLLYIGAGTPVGAALIAIGAALMYPAGAKALKVLLPLLAFQLIYFSWHAAVAFYFSSVPMLVFAILGWLLVVLFLALVWVWAQRRPALEPARQLVLDLQLGAAICFFTAAWHACGFASVPGFGVYPQLAQKFGNQSFLIGQALAVNVFACLGFVFLLLAVRAKPDEKIE